MMEDRVRGISDNTCHECVWLLEHPSVYTGGISAVPSDLLDHDRFLVCRSSRGGGYTYHGPGQRLVYLMLDLRKRGHIGIRWYVAELEKWVIRVLARWGIHGKQHQSRVGVWVQRVEPVTSHAKLGIEDQKHEAKIAAIGIRVRHWITSHGICINVSPNLDHFSGIIPCGISDSGVTSLAELGFEVSMKEIDSALREEFDEFLAFVN